MERYISVVVGESSAKCGSLFLKSKKDIAVNREKECGDECYPCPKHHAQFNTSPNTIHSHAPFLSFWGMKQLIP